MVPRALPAGLLGGMLLFGPGPSHGAVGSVRTTDDQNLKGEVSLDPGGFTITTAGTNRVPVPLSHLRLLRMESPEHPTAVPAAGTTNKPTAEGSAPLFEVPPKRGVLLCDGSFLTWGLRSVEHNRLRFWDGNKSGGIPLSCVARIHYGDFKAPTMDLLRHARSGVLLWGGSFVEGEIRSFSERQVRVSSVLFGICSYDVGSKVAAVVFRAPTPSSCRHVLKLRTGALLRVDDLECVKNALLVKDGPLDGAKISLADLLELQMVGVAR